MTLRESIFDYLCDAKYICKNTKWSWIITFIFAKVQKSFLISRIFVWSPVFRVIFHIELHIDIFLLKLDELYIFRWYLKYYKNIDLEENLEILKNIEKTLKFLTMFENGTLTNQNLSMMRHKMKKSKIL